MPHIDLPAGEPGIRGPMRFRPETAKPLNELAEVLLRGPSTLSRGERELIAAYVSRLNACTFCELSHSAFAELQLEQGRALVNQVKDAPDSAEVTPKLRALLRIAGAVQRGGKNVGEADVAAARELGATDVEIHDTVLIAAAFCMYNRYVDGLATWQPADPDDYLERGRALVERGYIESVPTASAA
ncbi:MAG TPA: peroxidase-related enzyme [Solirubrobacteraceae bacterium]|nr:peroxidase-related enzyme [Solirubrobacteraceae bacterium]